MTTPSQTRNSIKKCLKAIVDPKPKKADKDRIWSYFENRCAYCGAEIVRDSRKGHIDHLFSEMEGGSNRLSNLVLTCATCNGDEKREEDWESFLATKYGANKEIIQERSWRIRRWIELNGGQPMLTKDQQEILETEFNNINNVLSEAVNRLREMK